MGRLFDLEAGGKRKEKLAASRALGARFPCPPFFSTFKN